MTRLALLAVGIIGLLFTAWLDDPENYAHDAPLPATAAPTTTSTVVVATSPVLQATTGPSIAVTTATHATTTVPTTTVFVLRGRCSEARSFAASFWPEHELDTLDAIIWAESRCQPDATNGHDHGLLQINWPTWGPMVTELGYTKADLYDPAVNLMIGEMIAGEAERIGWCRFQPWHWSGAWC
jgi:hypothetical protein